MLRYLIILLIILTLPINACSRKQKNKDVVAKINNYNMTVEDFKQDLRALSVYRPRSIKSLDDKMQILNDLIKKEVLLQDAQSLGLDKNEKFRRTIENYWKQTLLKLLIEKKSKEISDKVHIYDNEIHAFYNTLRSKNPTIGSYETMKGRLRRNLRRKKETAMMQQWLDGLLKQADIQINKEILKKIEIKN